MDNSGIVKNIKPFESNSIEQNQNNLSNDVDDVKEVDSSSESDHDEYIDLSSKLTDNSEHIFQFNISNNTLVLKNIGKCNVAPDIIIMENFGPESNLSLYNCVYTYTELIELSKNNDTSEEISNSVNGEISNCDNELFFPLVKLIGARNNNFDISCIAVKLTQSLVFDIEIGDWELYWVENKHDQEHIKTFKLEKNINPSNIIEKLIELSF